MISQFLRFCDQQASVSNKIVAQQIFNLLLTFSIGVVGWSFFLWKLSLVYCAITFNVHEPFTFWLLAATYTSSICTADGN
jgi:hypothetical protein